MRRTSCRPNGREGFIIVAVLWILLALATLATIYSVYVANAAAAMSLKSDRLKAEELVSAGLELAIYQLSSPAKQDRPSRGAFNFRLGHARVMVDFSSEAARIDLNAAPKELLAGLFAVLGASSENAAFYASRIIAWRTLPKPDAPDEEESLYRAAGLHYRPRGGPFAHVNELWLVHGLPPALIERAMPYVTVFSGLRDVNILDAAPEVIAALPGMTPGRLTAFLRNRDTSDRQLIVSALGSEQPGATTEASSAVRVLVDISFDNSWQTASEVVIVPGSNGDPFGVLSWRDDVTTRAPTGTDR